MPIPEEAARGLREGDRFLASFPRSGGRWLAMLLRYAVAKAVGAEAGEIWNANEFDDGPPDARPGIVEAPQAVSDLYARGADRRFGEVYGVPYIFRLHDLTQIPAFRDVPIVYVFREPSDALASWFQFQREAQASGEFLSEREFCAIQLPVWEQQIRAALDGGRRHRRQTHLCRYENLVDEPAAELRRALAVYGIEISRELTEESGARLKRYFDDLNANRARQPWAAGKQVRGRPGRGAIEFDADTREAIRRRAGDLYERACEAAAPFTRAAP